MINYDLARLAKTTKPIVLPKLEERRATELAYLKALRLMLRGLARAGAAELATIKTQRLVRVSGDSVVVVDAGPDDNLAASLARIATRMVERILELESKRHTETFIEQVKSKVGIDLSVVVRQEDLRAYLDAASERNAALIKGLSEETAAKVKSVMVDAVINGKPVRETQKRIARILRVEDSRARLIARDQTAKLNSDLNRIRHKQAGINRYIWRTSLDERVRPRHRRLEGKTYRYGQKTGAEEGLPPGQPIQCRCIAQAIVE